MGFLNFLADNRVLAISAALAAAAMAVKAIASPHTVAYHIADVVLGFTAVHGVASSADTSKK